MPFHLVKVFILGGWLLTFAGIGEVAAQPLAAPDSHTIDSRTINAASPPYSVTCDGITDTTSAINAAIAAAQKTSYSVLLPAGMCLISGPIVLTTASGEYPTLLGSHGVGTTILANYANWSSKTDYNAVEIAVPGPAGPAEPQAERMIGDMIIKGENNANIPNSTGLAIHSTVGNISGPGAESASATYRLKVRNLEVYQFDTCYAVSDAVEADFDFAAGSYCRVGMEAQGYLINVTIRAARFNFSSTAFSSTKGGTTGIQLAGKQYPCSSCSGGLDFQNPQGVTISDSDILNWTNDIEVDNSLYTNIHDNVLDIGTGSTIRVQNPSWLDIHDNYIHAQGPGSIAVDMVNSSNVTALWIKDNYISGSGSLNQIGIEFPEIGSYWSGVHIDSNHFNGLNLPIFIGEPLVSGDIDNNTGDGNMGTLTTFGAALSNFEINSNRTTDTYSALGGGTFSHITVGVNQSNSAVTSTNLASGFGFANGSAIFSSSNIPVTTSNSPSGTCTADGYISFMVNGVTLHVAICK